MTRRLASRVLAAAALVGLGVAACARPFPPPGGERPDQAPAVIAVTPEPLSVHAALTGPVVFRFDRRISERLAADPVIVSPATSPVRVQRGRSEIRVSLAGGWQPGHIYHVVLLPGVSDLFNNTTTQPLELVFSTGPAIPATAVAGMVTDRLTGRPAANALVEAVRQADSVVYMAPADTGGFFSLRYLPLGEYEARAFTDVNRNRRLDASEPVSPTEHVVLDAPTDTVPLLFAVLPPDTTPAQLVRAQAQDSLRVVLSFDDYFAADEPLDAATVELVVLPDSTPGPAGRLLNPADAETLRAADRAAVAAGDTAAAAPVPPVAAAAPAAGPPRQPLPARDLLFVADTPLQPETEYRITVSGVRNIAGVEGGGGTTTFQTTARPVPAGPPPGTPPDTVPAGAGVHRRAPGLTLP